MIQKIGAKFSSASAKEYNIPSLLQLSMEADMLQVLHQMLIMIGLLRFSSKDSIGFRTRIIKGVVHSYICEDNYNMIVLIYSANCKISLKRDEMGQTGDIWKKSVFYFILHCIHVGNKICQHFMDTFLVRNTYF